MSENRLDGKVALITGGGSDIGLGWAMARALLAAGAKVALMDVDANSLQERLAEASRSGDAENTIAITGDVTNPADAPRAVQEVLDRLGGFHILINNAGISPARGAAFWISSRSPGCERSPPTSAGHFSCRGPPPNRCAGRAGAASSA